MNEDSDRQFLEKRKKYLRTPLWVGIIVIAVGLVLSVTCYMWSSGTLEEFSRGSRDFRSNVETMNRKTLEQVAVRRDKSILEIFKLRRENTIVFILAITSVVSLTQIVSYRREKRYLEIISRLQETY